MTIGELSGDSTVSGVAFAAGEVRFRFEDGETGVEYAISVPTQALYSQTSFEDGSVHIRLIQLNEVLPIDPKLHIYLAPQEFGAQTQAAREGFTLAIGRKSRDWPLFLQIRGYEILIACLVQSEEDICIKLQEN